MKRSEHPINWKRAALAGLGVYAACVVFAVALELLLLEPLGTPLVVRWLIGLVIGAVGLYVVLPRCRPWYRPAPEREQWTEDRL